MNVELLKLEDGHKAYMSAHASFKMLWKQSVKSYSISITKASIQLLQWSYVYGLYFMVCGQSH